MNDFIEQRIITAVRELLTGRVNEILKDVIIPIPIIEFGEYKGSTVVAPVIALSTCERTEKERIIRQDVYSLTISFELPETGESENYIYAYSTALIMAVCENPTLGDIADRAVVTGKKYLPPKKPGCGECWGLTVSLRITIGEC